MSLTTLATAPTLTRSGLAIEMQVEFLVKLVLSIAMFIVGLYILHMIFSPQPPIVIEPDPGPEQVALSKTYDEVKAGKAVTESIGIRNDLGTQRSFHIKIECDNAYTNLDTPICDNSQNMPCGDCGSAVSVISPQDIKADERFIGQIMILTRKEMDKGTYTYDVRVCLDSGCAERYGTTQKLRIKVV
jgi:hypothetical protein